MATVTISRLYGSGGEEIARLVCERLGYAYFDKSMMQNICKTTDLNCDNLDQLSGEVPKVRGALEQVYTSIPPWLLQGGAWLGEKVVEIDRSVTIEVVERLIQEAHARGKVVIMGRGGQVVLRNKPDVFHVRIVAPLENRLRTVADRDKISADAARDLIRHRDQAAFDYVQDQYRVNPGDNQLYDLVINTGKVAVAAAADLIVKSVELMSA